MVLVLLTAVSVLFIGRQQSGPAGHVVASHDPAASTTTLYPGDKLRIASWNLQRFGPDKAGNASMLAYYADVLGDYDIIILQEITDSSGDAFPKLCSLLPGYSCLLSDRLGSSSYKEQYGLVYRNAVLLGTYKGGAGYARTPYTYHLRSGNWSFYLTTIHTDPGNVKAELSLMEKEVSMWGISDQVIIGDLNADCAYYKTPPAEFADWTWIIPDDEDTTVKSSVCAYDRIIVNKGAANNCASYNVMRNVSSQQSDHFLVSLDCSTASA